MDQRNALGLPISLKVLAAADEDVNKQIHFMFARNLHYSY